jgi:biopolymer transport protein ExbD
MSSADFQTDAPDDVESSAAFLRPRPKDDDEIDITPMIDCVFLLLIFFIINFRADPSKAVSLPVARYGNPVLGLDSVFITVMSGEGNGAQIYLADEADPTKLIRTANLLDQEQAIVDYVEREVKGTPPKRQVIIKGGGQVAESHIARVAKAVGRATDGQTLHIAVTGESGKP